MIAIYVYTLCIVQISAKVNVSCANYVHVLRTLCICLIASMCDANKCSVSHL